MPGVDPSRSPARPAAPTRSPENVAEAAQLRAEADLADAIARGEDLERAVVRSVAALAALPGWHAAWSIAEGAGRLPGGERARLLGRAVLWHRRRQFGRVWPLLCALDDGALAAYVPVEAIDAALADGSADARRRALAIAAPSERMAPDVAVDLAGRLLAFGEREAAAALIAELRRRPTVELDERRRYAWALIERWIDPPSRSIPPGSIPVALLDYQTPDHVLTSGNLGDYIQTLSLVGNLVRFGGVTFTGDDGLGEVATDLQPRVRPDLRRHRPTGSVHLIAVNREFSSADDVPPGTWMVAFGWHMHPLYDLRYDFPYHPNIRPLFLSFHVNRLDMLDEAALAYLRRHGPIGCRDWTTVFLLLSAGVDAFFSGCLTTTVDALFPAREAVYDGQGAVGLIDLPRHAASRDASNVRTFSHQSDAYRFMSAAEGLRAAESALGAYQRGLERAVTGRLHAFLPLTALGIPVEFRTGSPGDVRFAGLTDLHPGDPRLDELRSGIRDLVGAVFERVLGGADEAEVRELWRDLTRDRVAEAWDRFEAPVDDVPTEIDVTAAVAASRAASRRFGPHERVDPETVTDLVVAFDQNLTTPAAVLLESIVTHASGTIRVWILGRGLTEAYQEWLAGAFPAVPMTFLPCDGIDYRVPGKQKRRIPSRITVSTMDRLLLPRLLEDVARVVYLDVDTLVLDDVCLLARTDLGGRPIAARDSNVSEASEWQRAGRPLKTPLATELRRRMGLHHGFGHAALNAGALVMDLERMRRDDFTTRYLGIGERYGLHDQDTMLAYVGPNRAVIEPRWNAMPTLEDVDDPALIHWASFPKPWEERLTYEQDRWRAYAARLHDRAGPAPTAAGSVGASPGSLPNPARLGPTTVPLRPEVERVIHAVRAEHLSYLDVPSLRTLAAMVEAIEADAIEGLVIEAGTALGGSAITLAAAKSAGREMKVYDVFGMIPPPGNRDGEDVHRRYATIAGGTSKGIAGDTYYGYRPDLLFEVTESFTRLGVPIGDRNVELIRGRFEDTIHLDEPVAFAHLDGDWYASTMTCLTRIAPLLSVGGRIVVDDYETWSGCRAAVDEYFAGRPGYRFEHRGRLHIVRS